MKRLLISCLLVLFASSAFAASGDTLVIFTPFANEPPSSSPATLDVRFQRPVIDFDADADECAVFTAIMPQSYAGTTGVTVFLDWSATTGVADDIRLDVYFEEVTRDSLDTDADDFAAANSVTDIAPGTSGHVTQANVTFTDGVDMDSVGAGDLFRIKVCRDADNGASLDDMTGDAEIHAIEIQET